MMSLMLWSLSAFGADPEAERIAESLIQSVREGEWRAVERRYLELVRDHPSGLSGPIHHTGAQAARQRGELLLAAQRLLRVRERGQSYTAAQGDLEQLRAQTGLVILTLPEGVTPALRPSAVPFASDLRVSIEEAEKTLVSTGVFVGLLPVGEYTMGANTFRVRAGFDWQLAKPR